MSGNSNATENAPAKQQPNFGARPNANAKPTSSPTPVSNAAPSANPNPNAAPSANPNPNVPWYLKFLSVSARTDVGMRRSNNQDSFSVATAATPRLWLARGHVFVVADGMGAHAAGELASKMAATIVPQSYLKRVDQPVPDALRDAMLQAHEEIRRRGSGDEEAFRDMGTTCDALILLPQGAVVGHVGDSRVYRLRDGVYEQLTFDHSLRWEVKRSRASHPEYGRVKLDQIPKNVITRSFGPTDPLVVDLEGPFPLEPGDAFLLCSDGLAGQLADSEMGQILDAMRPEEATETLINLANLRGGPDNITVVVARIESTPDVAELEREARATGPVEKKPPLTNLAWTAFSLAVASFLATPGALFLSEGRALVVCLSLLSTAIFAGAFFWAARERFFAPKKDAWADAPLGKGPYVRASAAPTAEFCAQLAELCGQLCDTVRNQRLCNLDWKGVETATKQASAAAASKNFAASLRASASVVNYIMREIKKTRKPADKKQK